MSKDLISREALKEKLTTTILTADPQYMFDEIMDIIDNAPVVKSCDNCDLYFKAMTKEEMKHDVQ